ncbi:hypothetical protein SMSP2_01794 [Limihaloglobus sulfuriphilus]|uniref:Uncharacterized protein n=1 Tax=Limihaloglobus sulfuriphilus TaxID=1851148 RepID=A0A1Q2MFH5_9BACT|nr:hypothetical protein [Limihaloglobus sulfuriphilus]AQQ71420.1 hypothetical protein SMSP2_01794 [Limihaloglobus sulfuriphilus]
MAIVEIVVSEGHTYSCLDKLGQEFTSVSYAGKLYGGASPCNNPEQITRAIAGAKKSIIKEGDTPKLKDQRENLSKWLD